MYGIPRLGGRHSFRIIRRRRRRLVMKKLFGSRRNARRRLREGLNYY